MKNYLVRLLKRFSKNAALRLQISSMAVSTSAYAVSIFFLADEERGVLTAFLYANYLIVGLSFFGTTILVAHWDKAPYQQRLALSLSVAKPGLVAGTALAVTGVLIIYIAPAENNQLPLLLFLFGAFVFTSTLSEVIFAAKTSSEPRVTYWQHYLYFSIFLASLTSLTVTANLGFIEIILAYLLASIPYLFARWIPIGGLAAATKGTRQKPRVDRVEAAKLFVGTFTASMQIRLVSLVVIAVHGAAYLGKYLVLWLAFEVLEQLYRFALLTEIYNIKSRQRILIAKEPWDDVKHVIRIGVPGILAIGVGVYFLAPSIIDITKIDLLVAVLFLTLNYLGRLILNFRLNYLLATNQIGVASKISVANTAGAMVLATLLPPLLGFSGVAIALALSSVASLIVSVARKERTSDN